MSVPFYAISDLYNLSEEAIWALPDRRFEIHFDDGRTLLTTHRRTVLSWYFWRMHREFPGCPVMVEHHIGNNQFVKGAELKLAERILWDVYDHLPPEKRQYSESGRPQVIWDMSLVAYEVINAVHNMVVSRLGEYVTSVDLSDVAQIMTHPEIVAAKKTFAEAEEPDPEKTYNTINRIVGGPEPIMRHNRIAKLYRAGLLNTKQLCQFIGPRGFITNTDGTMFPEPIKVGYADGFKSMYDVAIEQRVAALSLYMNKGPLEQSEWFNRKMQLLTSVIKTVHGHDCGAKHPIPWILSEEDLKGLVGKYHMVKGQPVLFDPKDTQYLGKVIYLRSITTCENADTSTVCHTCLGQIADVLPERTNLGHFIAIEPLAKLSSLILSTKHLVASSFSSYMDISGPPSKWLKQDRQNKTSIILSRSSPSGHFILRFGASEIPGLNSIISSDDPAALSPQRVSQVTHIRIAALDKNDKPKGDWLDMNTMIAGAGSALSTEVIKAIKRNGYEIVEDCIEVKLDHFRNKELFITSLRSENLMDYLNVIKHFLLGADNTTKREEEKRRLKGPTVASFKTIGQALAELKRIMDEKIDNNILHAEIFIRACMTVNGYENDFRIPRGGEPFVLMCGRRIIEERSLSTMLAFQSQNRQILNPATYINFNRMEHPLDPMFNP